MTFTDCDYELLNVIMSYNINMNNLWSAENVY